jgi:hypothetical protein
MINRHQFCNIAESGNANQHHPWSSAGSGMTNQRHACDRGQLDMTNHHHPYNAGGSGAADDHPVDAA